MEIIESISVTKEKISFYNESLGFTQEETKKIFNVKDDKKTGSKYITAEKGPVSVRYNLQK